MSDFYETDEGIEKVQGAFDAGDQGRTANPFSKEGAMGSARAVSVRGSSKMSDVYLVTMEAVYDHGNGGVFSTLEAAEDHARALWLRSDGHHDFRIERLVIDEPRKPQGSLGDPERRGSKFDQRSDWSPEVDDHIGLTDGCHLWDWKKNHQALSPHNYEWQPDV